MGRRKLNLLLDTHALLWWMLDDPALSPRAREAIADRRTSVYVSSASAWEIAIKWRLGRMPEAGEVAARFPELLVQAGFEPLPISVAHALAAGCLSVHHRDPFDRMLVAQATIENLRLVTKDAAVTAIATNVLW